MMPTKRHYNSLQESHRLPEHTAIMTIQPVDSFDMVLLLVFASVSTVESEASCLMTQVPGCQPASM